MTGTKNPLHIKGTFLALIKATFLRLQHIIVQDGKMSGKDDDLSGQAFPASM